MLGTNTTNQFVTDQTDFSLALGGPLYQLYLRTKLVRPALELLLRRIIAISLFCWAPLLLLAAVAGQAVSGVKVPFLFDLGVHTRFLLALPLLIASEPIVHKRMKSVIEQFIKRGIIRPEDRSHFEAVVGSAMRFRNSVFAEIAILLLAIGVGYWTWRQYVVLGVSSWYVLSNDDGSWHLTAAGIWYAFVSSTILRFILFRWYYRIFVWYRFLWQVRSLPLHLNLFHPDRAGGLGFLGGSVFAFAPILVAQTVILAGIIGERIWHAGARLPSFKLEIFFVVAFLVLIVLAPLSFFAVRLGEAHHLATREYGILASHYVDGFYDKWIKEHGTAGEGLLGTPDLQSFADLGNGYNVVSKMRLVPISKETVLRLVILVILPLLPLVLTMIPLDQVIDRAVKLVF